MKYSAARTLPLLIASRRRGGGSSSNPAQPTASGPGPRVRCLQPANGAQIGSGSQPVTLVVANATTTVVEWRRQL